MDGRDLHRPLQVFRADGDALQPPAKGQAQLLHPLPELLAQHPGQVVLRQARDEHAGVAEQAEGGRDRFELLDVGQAGSERAAGYLPVSSTGGSSSWQKGLGSGAAVWTGMVCARSGSGEVGLAGCAGGFCSGGAEVSTGWVASRSGSGRWACSCTAGASTGWAVSACSQGNSGFARGPRQRHRNLRYPAGEYFFAGLGDRGPGVGRCPTEPPD